MTTTETVTRITVLELDTDQIERIVSDHLAEKHDWKVGKVQMAWAGYDSPHLTITHTFTRTRELGADQCPD